MNSLIKCAEKIMVEHQLRGIVKGLGRMTARIFEKAHQRYIGRIHVAVHRQQIVDRGIHDVIDHHALLVPEE